MSVNIIAITPASNLVAINSVLEAMGRGPTSLTIKASTNSTALWDDEPTHYFMSDQGAPDWLAETFLRFGNGDLPALADGFVWGENGCISAADALDAIKPENFAFACFNNGFSVISQVESALGSYDPPLFRMPDPPL